MNKANEVRELLTTAVPHLQKNPDALHIFIEEGNLEASWAGKNLSFEYQFNLIILVTDYSQHADTLMVPLLAWVAQHQPELLTNPDKRKEGIRFRADMLNHKTADIEITLQLTERVKVTVTEGGVEVVHLPEPVFDPYEGMDWTLFVKDVQVSPPPEDEP